MVKTNNILTIAIAAILMAVLASCRDSVTYKEQRDQEIAAINSYISENGIKVISEETFFAQDSTTDVSKNEFVLFEASGVYMQIVRKGCGQKLRNGETATVLCRFTEYNLKLGGDSISLTNEFYMNSSLGTSYVVNPDRMTITNNSGTYSGNFDTTSYMYLAYGLSTSSSSTVVLSGWLVPFAYINLGRPANDGDQVAKVRIIVPHKQGHLTASGNVTPYLYDITFERGR